MTERESLIANHLRRSKDPLNLYEFGDVKRNKIKHVIRTALVHINLSMYLAIDSGDKDNYLIPATTISDGLSETRIGEEADWLLLQE